MGRNSLRTHGGLERTTRLRGPGFLRESHVVTLSRPEFYFRRSVFLTEFQPVLAYPNPYQSSPGKHLPSGRQDGGFGYLFNRLTKDVRVFERWFFNESETNPGLLPEILDEILSEILITRTRSFTRLLLERLIPLSIVYDSRMMHGPKHDSCIQT